MSTGIETWNMNLLDIGPMYPWPGWEMLFALIGIVTWIIWHLIQIRWENSVYDKEERHYANKEMLGEAMQVSNAETLIESLKTHGPNYKQP